MTTETIMPNPSAESTPAANVENAAPLSDDSLFAKMTAMRESTERNQLRALNDAETGSKEAAISSRPVAPEEPEVSTTQTEEAEATLDYETQDEEPVSEVEGDSTPNELIDFIEFTETNPNAKFKFTRDGKEVVIDAKKAAAILGQGGAIHEDARKLKIERAEFDEYLKEQKQYQQGLALAMEFTVTPRLKQAYDEIVKTQGYNQVFNEQLQRTQDPTEIAQIQANIQQNNRYMRQQGDLIQRVKPNVDQFKQIRQKQVTDLLDQSRKSFTDKELKNEYVFNELREKLSKQWSNASLETVPGIKNLDLITSDETILSLIRDGMKFRDKPTARQAGGSIAAVTGRKAGATTTARNSDDGISKLREQAKNGDKKAGNDLLTARLAQIRSKNR
jgi:hypothetical protein